jgi:hypothetical protein
MVPPPFHGTRYRGYGCTKAFAFISGSRTPSDILTLDWRQVDLRAGEARLDRGMTKNGEFA